MNDTRAQRGERQWNAVFGTSSDAVVTAFDDIAPGFGVHIRDFAFGDIMGEGQLSPKERQIATVAMLTALGNAREQLAVHIKGARHAGCSQAEVVDVIKQVAIYAGFPAAINGLNVARTVFGEEDA